MRQDDRGTFATDRIRLRSLAQSPPAAPQDNSFDLYFKNGRLFKVQDDGAEVPIEERTSGQKFQFNNRYFDHVQKETTGAGFQVATTLALAGNSVVDLQARVVGRRTDGGGNERVIVFIEGCFYRTTGSAIQQGSTLQHLRRSSAGGLDAQFSVSGNNVQVEVKGAAAQTFHWTIALDWVIQDS